MPFIGLGIHFLVALFFAIHALKTGRNMFWLIVLFSFPLLGSIVYFVVEYWPEMRNSRTARSAGNALRNMVDPKREPREARDAFEVAPTVASRMRLADALAASGDHRGAREHLQACLEGAHTHDADVLAKLAAVNTELKDAKGVTDALALLFKHYPERHTGDNALLYARALSAQDDAGTQAAFDKALSSASGPEAKLRHGQWLASTGRPQEARRQFEQIEKDSKLWTPHARSLNQQWLVEAHAAMAQLPRD